MKRRRARQSIPFEFSKFDAKTRLSDADVIRLQNASGNQIRITKDIKAAIELALRQFEYVRAYEAQGRNEPKRAALRDLAASLEKSAELATSFNKSPYLWPEIATMASLPYEEGLQDLNAMAKAARSVSDKVEKARSVKIPDEWLPWLLVQLEEQYKKAGGRKTGVSNNDGKRRGRFVDFCDAAISMLHSPAIPKVSKTGEQKSVGTLWATIYAKKNRPTNPGSEAVWVSGKRTKRGSWPGTAIIWQLFR